MLTAVAFTFLQIERAGHPDADLACCASGMAFYSTPSDLVRFALATHTSGVNGALVGGMVMPLMTEPDSGIAIAVTSNMAHANTYSLARRVGDAFAEQTR